MHHICSSAKVIGRNNLLPFQIGCMVSIRSLQGLFDSWKSEGYQNTYWHPNALTTYYILSKSAYDSFKTVNCNREEFETLSGYVFRQLDGHQVTNDITSDPNESVGT